jgi:hypothetical protein
MREVTRAECARGRGCTVVAWGLLDGLDGEVLHIR